MDCPNCGISPAHSDQQFCVQCGTNLAPVEPPVAYGQATRVTGPLFADDLPPPPPHPPPPSPPPAPPLPPSTPPTFAAPAAPTPASSPPPLPPAPPPAPAASYDDQPRRGMRTSIVLLAVAALFAALIGATGVVLLFGGNDDPESNATAEDRDSGNRKKDRGPTGPTSSEPGETETDEAEPPSFRCWNGGVAVTRLATCPPPTGADGLAWVFPSAIDATCVVEPGAQRATESECSPVVEGAAVRFHYSEWRTRPALETYYSGNTVAVLGPPDGRDDLTVLRVESRDSSVGYKVAIYYTDPIAFWSVTIYAADEAEYLAAVDRLVMRPFRQFRGKRV